MDDVQKKIVSVGRARETEAMINIMNDLSESTQEYTGKVSDVKLALTISGTYLESFKDHGSLLKLYTISKDLIERYKCLQDVENVRFTLLKLQLALGMVEAAVNAIESFSEPRLRMFTAILERCAETKDHRTALRVLQLLPNFGLRVTEREIPLVLRCGLSFRDLDEFLSSFSLEFEDPYTESVFAFEESEGVDVSVSIPIAPDGDSVCPVTGIKLERLSLGESELDELIAMTRSLATEAGFTTKEDFDNLLITQLSELPQVVLDGANIAHVNQNFVDGYFRFDQIRDILSNFSDKKCLVVLHSKWLSNDRDLRLFPIDGDQTTSEPKRHKKRKKPALPPLGVTGIIHQDIHQETERTEKTEIIRPVPVDLINEWRERHILFQVPHKLNDDWFWMHICCLAIKGGNSNLLLVSNDLMRDHYWRMQHPKAFNRFVRNHVCQYSIKFGEDGINRYEYTYPPNHSICMHRHEILEDGIRKIIWHIPYRSESSEIKWLVVRFTL